MLVTICKKGRFKEMQNLITGKGVGEGEGGSSLRRYSSVKWVGWLYNLGREGVVSCSMCVLLRCRFFFFSFFSRACC